jgi:low temperature requirement protein LtrA
MRLGMVALWVRAAVGDPARRQTAVRYAVGILVVQVLWIARLWVPQPWLLPTFALLVLAELSVPYLAEGRQGQTPWHRHHIAERFSLMSIIVLGEVLLSSVMAVQGATHVGWSLVPLVVGGLLVVFSMWWIYFSHEHHELTDGGAITWLFSYGHVVIFASIAAIGAGLGAAVDAVGQDAGGQHAHGAQAGGAGGTAVWVMAVGVTVACLVLGGVHALARRSAATLMPAVFVGAGTCVAAALPLPLQWRVLALGAVLALAVADHVRRSTAAQGQGSSGDAASPGSTHLPTS